MCVFVGSSAYPGVHHITLTSLALELELVCHGRSNSALYPRSSCVHPHFRTELQSNIVVVQKSAQVPLGRRCIVLLTPTHLVLPDWKKK